MTDARWEADAEIQEDETVHVWPLSERAIHVLEGFECWCHPELELGEEATLVIHNRKQ